MCGLFCIGILIAYNVKTTNEERLKVLDIGCGWGYFPSYINNKTNNFVAGITISSKQFEYMNTMYSNQVNDNKVSFKYLDYRDLYKTYGANYFDRAVSIGMLEHVGISRLNEYFEAVWNVLKPDSYFLLHYISRTDIHPTYSLRKRETACLPTNYVNIYMFPTGCTLLPDWVYQAADETGFVLLHQEHYGKHYLKTINLWMRNMQKNKEKILNNTKYDIQFFKMYEFYFAFGQATFRTGLTELVQQIYYKPKSRDPNTAWNHDLVVNPNY